MWETSWYSRHNNIICHSVCISPSLLKCDVLRNVEFDTTLTTSIQQKCFAKQQSVLKVKDFFCVSVFSPDCKKDGPSLLLVLKWGGELTPAGRVQAEELGRAFRCMYPGGQGSKHTHTSHTQKGSKVAIKCFFSLYRLIMFLKITQVAIKLFYLFIMSGHLQFVFVWN